MLRIAAPLFVLAGLYGFVYELVRGARLRWFRNPAVLMLFAASIYFFIYFYGHYISAGDDFNHWAIVVRVMLRYDRLPRFTDTIIMFPSYPTGAAGLIYLICKILGSESGGTLLFAQTFLMLCGVLPLFALVRHNRAASCCVVILTALIGLTMNADSAIQSLYVDALLALVCLSGVAIGRYYRNDILQRWWVLLPIGCFLAVIKGSGLYFSAVLAVQAAAYLWPCGERRKKWVRILWLVLAPMCLLLLWNRHADLVFEGGLMTRHSISLRYMLNQTLDKSGGELLETVRRFLTALGDLSSIKPVLATFGLLLGCAWLGRLSKARSGFGAGALLKASCAIYLTYMLGILGMYLFNMPENTIEAFLRYETTCLILLAGLAAIYLIELFNGLSRVPCRAYAASLAAAAALFAAFCLTVRLPLRTLVEYPVEKEQSARELAAYMPVRDKETRYLVYVWDGHREQNYGHRLVHYTAYPAQSDIVSAEDNGLAMLDTWTQDYDYFIAFWTDDAYAAYAGAHGIDPEVRLWTPEAYVAALKSALIN